MIRINENITLTERELEFQFIRASGPGGQNVNKVASAVQLRFDVARSPSLPGDVKRRLTKQAGKRMSSDGVLILTARRFRTQETNRADAVERLVKMIRRATHTPKPRKKTRPTRTSVERRLQAKKIRSKKKQLRRNRPPDTD